MIKQVGGPLVGAAAVRELTAPADVGRVKDPLRLTPEEKAKIREGWLARRATTKAEPATMCLAKHTHKGAYWQVCCSCSREPGHPADYHEDASVPVRWAVEALGGPADVEHTGDRGPAPSSDLLRAHAAVDGLPPRMLAMATWMLSELPGLEAKCRAIKEEGREPVYQPDGSMTPNNWKPTPRPVGALAALLGAVRAWRAAFDPRGGGE